MIWQRNKTSAHRRNCTNDRDFCWSTWGPSGGHWKCWTLLCPEKGETPVTQKEVNPPGACSGEVFGQMKKIIISMAESWAAWCPWCVLWPSGSKVNWRGGREHFKPSFKQKRLWSSEGNHESKCATEQAKKQKLVFVFHGKVWLLFCSLCCFCIIHWWLRQLLGQCLLNEPQGIIYDFWGHYGLASLCFIKMRPQRQSLLDLAGSDTWVYASTSCPS